MKALRRLAASFGVQSSYRGVNGDLVEAEPEPLLALLRTLGAEVTGVGDAEAALRARRESLARCLLPPAVALFADAPSRVPLTVPSGARGTLRFDVSLEGGGGGALDVSLETLPVQRRGPGWERRLLDLPDLPVGYHEVRCEHAGRTHHGHLLRAPRGVFRSAGERRRQWGLFAPLYAFRSEKGFPLADLGELERFVDLVGDSGGAFAATLPLYAGFPEEASPYSPLSRLFWNELYLDPTRTPEWARSARAREIAASGEFRRAVEETDAARHVDYELAQRLRRPLIEALSEQSERDRPEVLARLRASSPSSVAYARFRATLEEGSRGSRPAGWTEADLVPADHPAARWHLYAQLAMSEQLDGLVARAAERGVGLYFDLPLGVHPEGYDVWRYRGSFAENVEVGAPPDAVFTDGQSWGFPPLLPQASRASGYDYTRRVVAEAMRHASILRIDHVMGLHRQFWIPSGFEKRQGIYVRYPAEELYAVLAIESHRAGTEVAGENLGMVPETVDRSLARHELFGLYVLQYSLTGRTEDPFRGVPERAVASLGTHDTPLFAGFCRDRDIAWREARGLDEQSTAQRGREERARQIEALDRWLGGPFTDLEERLDRWLQHLLASPAERVAITLEDLWLEEDPQNVPGTTEREHANWRRKLLYALSRLPDSARRRLHAFDRSE